jgi:hypothetical protein
MKNTFVVLGAMLMIAATVTTSWAQGISVFGSVGYGLGRGGTYVSSSETYSADFDLVSKEDIYASGGKGFKIDGGVQIAAMKSVAIRLGGGFSKMPAIEEKDTFPGSTETATANFSFLHVDALLLVKTDLGSATLYGGAGGGLFFGSGSTEYNERDGSDQSVAKYEGGFDPALGFIGVAGIELPLGASNMGLFIEANLQQVSFLLTEEKIVKATENGRDVLSQVDLDFDTPGRQTVYKFEKDSTTKDAPEVIQGSNIGLRVGLRLGF